MYFDDGCECLALAESAALVDQEPPRESCVYVCPKTQERVADMLRTDVGEKGRGRKLGFIVYHVQHGLGLDICDNALVEADFFRAQGDAKACRAAAYVLAWVATSGNVFQDLFGSCYSVLRARAAQQVVQFLGGRMEELVLELAKLRPRELSRVVPGKRDL